MQGVIYKKKDYLGVRMNHTRVAHIDLTILCQGWPARFFRMEKNALVYARNFGPNTRPRFDGVIPVAVNASLPFSTSFAPTFFFDNSSHLRRAA